MEFGADLFIRKVNVGKFSEVKILLACPSAVEVLLQQCCSRMQREDCSMAWAGSDAPFGLRSLENGYVQVCFSSLPKLSMKTQIESSAGTGAESESGPGGDVSRLGLCLHCWQRRPLPPPGTTPDAFASTVWVCSRAEDREKKIIGLASLR